MGTLGKTASRGIAPFLKHILGPWFMLRHDLHGEVASTSQSTLEIVFPAEKLDGALQLFAEQVRNVKIYCSLSGQYINSVPTDPSPTGSSSEPKTSTWELLPPDNCLLPELSH